MNKRIKQSINVDGGITVFLSIIILVIFALIGTLIESARISVAKTRVGQATYISLNSVFSEYAKEVFDDYGILLLWESEDKFKVKLSDYLEKNLHNKVNSFQKNTDLLGIHVNKIELTDANNELGVIFANQVYEYMKYRVVGDAVNALLEKCDLLSQGKRITNFFDKIQSCSKKFEQVETSVSNIKKSIDKIKEVSKQPSDYIGELKDVLIKIRGVEDKVEKNNYFEEFKNCYIQYNDDWNKINSSLIQIKDLSNTYFQCVEDSLVNIEKLKQDLEENKNYIDQEMYELLENEIVEIDKQIANQSVDAYGVKKNYLDTIQYYEKMAAGAKEMVEINSNMEGILYNNLMLSDFETNGEFIETFISELEKTCFYYEGLNIYSLGVNYDVKVVEKSDNNIIDFIENIIGKDLTSIVADDVSIKKIDKSNLINHNSNLKENVWQDLNISGQAVRRALMGQYIFDHFSSYLDKDLIEKEEKSLDYEIEYILGQHDNDRDNLAYVINKIILIREGFNLISLFKNNKYREESYLLAVSLVGFTGMPVVIRLTQLLVMGLWAYAESVVDVRDLLNGYHVNILKSESDWNLSLNQIQKLSDKDTGKKSSKGLSYKEYLRFLLFIENSSKQTNGIMDIIQLNIRNRYNDEFSLEECIFGTKVIVECRVERLFTSIGFIKRMISDGSSGFTFNFEMGYSY